MTSASGDKNIILQINFPGMAGFRRQPIIRPLIVRDGLPGSNGGRFQDSEINESWGNSSVRRMPAPPAETSIILQAMGEESSLFRKM